MSTWALETVKLQHNRISLALHKVSDGVGRPLLLLHGLGENAQRMATVGYTWSGPVWALDFTGHGESTVPAGGGYSCEILMADVDIALRHIGEATVMGRGLGGYIALLIAGARPTLVRGAIVMDGPGLAGGATHVTSGVENVSAGPRMGTAPDPWALLELTRDARPQNYVVTFAQLAAMNSGIEEPIALTTKVSPPWIEALRPLPGVINDISVEEALEQYAAI